MNKILVKILNLEKLISCRYIRLTFQHNERNASELTNFPDVVVLNDNSIDYPRASKNSEFFTRIVCISSRIVICLFSEVHR